jgi:hypothetical protein
MIRWRLAYIRATIALGALAALFVGSGAGMRW